MCSSDLNSCAAIAAGCLQALERSADAIVLALAADHHIPDRHAFAAAVADGLADAQAGRLLTFGVRPRSRCAARTREQLISWRHWNA